MVSKKLRLAALMCMSLAVSSFIPVLAHAPVPPLPLVKSSLLARQLLLRSVGSGRIPGLSGSASAFANQTRLITQNGVNFGVSQSLANALNGPLSSGVINGTFYEAVSGTPPFIKYPQPQFIVALGNSPYSTHGFQTGMTIPTTIGNSLVFSPASFTHGSKVVGSLIPPPYLSGSQRAFQDRLRAITNNAVAAGEKLGNSEFSSPIVAGNLYGTGYYQFNTAAPPFVYGAHGIFDLSFGSDPLNTPGGGGGINLNLASLRDYIQLANGKVFSFSSGLLAVSGYYQSGPFQGNRIFAIGNNPLNFFNNYGAIPPTITYTTFPASYLLR
jgi:hypothetical protein